MFLLRQPIPETCDKREKRKKFFFLLPQVRLNGIDTPEMRGSGPKEKEKAIQARDALSDKILDKIVRLENVGLEKYFCGNFFLHFFRLKSRKYLLTRVRFISTRLE